MNWFKKKTKTEIIDLKSVEILNDLIVSGFENDEIAEIINSIKDDGKHVLEQRLIMLEEECRKTVLAINSL